MCAELMNKITLELYLHRSSNISRACPPKTAIGSFSNGDCSREPQAQMVSLVPKPRTPNLDAILELISVSTSPRKT